MDNTLLAGGAMIYNPALGNNLTQISGSTFFSTFFGKLIELALVAGSIIFIFMLIMGGIAWISAGGDKNATEQARSRVTNALIGIVVLFAVFAIVNLAGYFFGNLNLLNLQLTPITP